MLVIAESYIFGNFLIRCIFLLCFLGVCFLTSSTGDRTWSRGVQRSYFPGHACSLQVSLCYFTLVAPFLSFNATISNSSFIWILVPIFSLKSLKIWNQLSNTIFECLSLGLEKMSNSGSSIVLLLYLFLIYVSVLICYFSIDMIFLQ